MSNPKIIFYAEQKIDSKYATIFYLTVRKWVSASAVDVVMEYGELDESGNVVRFMKKFLGRKCSSDDDCKLYGNITFDATLADYSIAGESKEETSLRVRTAWDVYRKISSEIEDRTKNEAIKNEQH